MEPIDQQQQQPSKLKSYIRFDWALKRLLRDKANFAVLEGFLSALLGENVTIIEILEGESNRYSAEDKSNIVDIKARNDHGEIVIIEVQNLFQMDFMQRIVYGASKAVVEQVSSGDRYGKIHKVYSIAIVYFDLGSGGNDYVFRGKTSLMGIHSHQELKVSEREREAYRGESFDIFPEYYILKVNNFNQVACTPLEEWMQYIKDGSISPDTNDRGLLRAKEILDFDRMTKAEYNDYMRYRNEKWSEDDSMAKSHDEGLAEGIAIGRKEGRKEGIEEGRAEERLKNARRMLNAGLPFSQVVAILGLTTEEASSLED